MLFLRVFILTFFSVFFCFFALAHSNYTIERVSIEDESLFWRGLNLKAQDLVRELLASGAQGRLYKITLDDEYRLRFSPREAKLLHGYYFVLDKMPSLLVPSSDAVFAQSAKTQNLLKHLNSQDVSMVVIPEGRGAKGFVWNKILDGVYKEFFPGKERAVIFGFSPEASVDSMIHEVQHLRQQKKWSEFYKNINLIKGLSLDIRLKNSLIRFLAEHDAYVRQRGYLEKYSKESADAFIFSKNFGVLKRETAKGYLFQEVGRARQSIGVYYSDIETGFLDLKEKEPLVYCEVISVMSGFKQTYYKFQEVIPRVWDPSFCKT